MAKQRTLGKRVRDAARAADEARSLVAKALLELAFAREEEGGEGTFASARSCRAGGDAAILAAVAIRLDVGAVVEIGDVSAVPPEWVVRVARGLVERG